MREKNGGFWLLVLSMLFLLLSPIRHYPKPTFFKAKPSRSSAAARPAAWANGALARSFHT